MVAWLSLSVQAFRFQTESLPEFDEGTAGAFVANGGLDGDTATAGDFKADIIATPPEEDEASGDKLEIPATTTPLRELQRGERVFITHGKNNKILGQLKEIVAYGKLEPVVAKERETAAKPVPDKVMDEMRACQAAVIHVGVENFLYDKEGNEYPQINGNVLIEIGAAMALYRRNFILLVEAGVQLPSNLQGLYECRYIGDELSGEATMKLLKAFNAFELAQ